MLAMRAAVAVPALSFVAPWLVVAAVRGRFDNTLRWLLGASAVWVAVVAAALAFGLPWLYVTSLVEGRPATAGDTTAFFGTVISAILWLMVSTVSRCRGPTPVPTAPPRSVVTDGGREARERAHPACPVKVRKRARPENSERRTLYRGLERGVSDIVARAQEALEDETITGVDAEMIVTELIAEIERQSLLGAGTTDAAQMLLLLPVI